MGKGKIFGSQGRIAVQRFGYLLGENFLHRKLDFQVCSGKCHLPRRSNSLKQGNVARH
jgi:hypothetical protein